MEKSVFEKCKLREISFFVAAGLLYGLQKYLEIHIVQWLCFYGNPENLGPNFFCFCIHSSYFFALIKMFPCM